MSQFAGRRLEQVWFWFFVIHIPITLTLDIQSLYPPSLLAGTPFPAFMRWYINFSRDPILLGAMSSNPAWDWLKCFLKMEAFVQLPSFFIGAYGLYKNDKRVYPLILAYGASTATTLVPTLNALLTDKSTPPLSTMELANLLGSYIPFLLFPLGMALDMGVKLIKLVQVAEGRKSV
ncbi:hypothetical protein EHS25_000424 [Saitozyma podzolica]|uniref:Efficient mitochondria targeting-associated protein 19 n=1 Tax=Saitozyma podzolica TaxID=1890683 RepID=A0A427YW69_9TREE|nr:hypothetical protein EHS25_000424 [Saitozyma podzolica]